MRFLCKLGLHTRDRLESWGCPDLYGLEIRCSKCDSKKYYIGSRRTKLDIIRLEVSESVFELLRMALVMQ